jgi:hypothetical protein
VRYFASVTGVVETEKLTRAYGAPTAVAVALAVPAVSAGASLGIATFAFHRHTGDRPH